MASSNGIVAYWDDIYVPKYMTDSNGDPCLSQVDNTVLYNGIDQLQIKVAGETTGVDNLEWFKDLEMPDIRNPFDVMVDIYIYIYLYI